MSNTYTTEAIVIHTMRHGDRGLILYTYTREHGRVAYYISSTKNNMATISGVKLILQPMSILKITGYLPSRGSLHRINNAVSVSKSLGIYSDPIKSAISMYMAEFIYKILREGESSSLMFDFISSSVQLLINMVHGSSNFHLYFTVNIIKFMGYAPTNDYFDGAYYDMRNCKYVIIPPPHDLVLSKNDSKLISDILKVSPMELDVFMLNRIQRREILHTMVRMLSFHHDANYKIDSIDIFGDVF